MHYHNLETWSVVTDIACIITPIRLRNWSPSPARAHLISEAAGHGQGLPTASPIYLSERQVGIDLQGYLGGSRITRARRRAPTLPNTRVREFGPAACVRPLRDTVSTLSVVTFTKAIQVCR